MGSKLDKKLARLNRDIASAQAEVLAYGELRDKKDEHGLFRIAEADAIGRLRKLELKHKKLVELMARPALYFVNE